jgi:hypothetical protein
MRLKKHFTEQPDKKTIDRAIKELSKKHKVKPKYLAFQFIWDVGEYGGGKQLHFEVNEPGHRLYGSTVSYKI